MRAPILSAVTVQRILSSLGNAMISTFIIPPPEKFHVTGRKLSEKDERETRNEP